MSTNLRLISVNVERSRHLERVLPFLVGEVPDVVCVQELMQEDIKQFEEALGMHCVFAPMTYFPDPEEHPRLIGVGLFTKLPVLSSAVHYYRGSADFLPVYDRAQRAKTASHALVVCEVEKDGVIYKVATTHFPVSEGGLADDQQREDMPKLLALVREEGGLVLCGDFNAPRGGEIFALVAAEYKDNIPPQYTTSIDGNYHRAGPLPYMVDGLFTTPSYSAHDVRLQDGVSDHMAIVATISKN